VERGGGSGFHVDRIPGAHRIGCLLTSRIHQNAALLDPILNPRAAEVRQALVQYVVEPFPGVVMIGGQSHEIVFYENDLAA